MKRIIFIMALAVLGTSCATEDEGVNPDRVLEGNDQLGGAYRSEYPVIQYQSINTEELYVTFYNNGFAVYSRDSVTYDEYFSTLISDSIDQTSIDYQSDDLLYEGTMSRKSALITMRAKENDSVNILFMAYQPLIW